VEDQETVWNIFTQHKGKAIPRIKSGRRY